MKKKDKQPLREESMDKLTERLAQTKKDFVSQLMEQKIGKLKDVHAPRKKRKEIAILKTIINQKILNRKKEGEISESKTN